MSYAHSADVEDSFFPKLKAIAFWIAPTLPQLAEWMLAVMYSESGVYAGAANSIGCVGLLGFCQTTSGYTQDQIHGMNATEQLDVVGPFVKSFAKHIERRGNVYQGNFLPGSFARGSSLGTVLAARGGSGYNGQEGAFYDANPLLDQNHDGRITVGDLEHRLSTIEKEPRFKELLQRLRAAPHPAATIAGQLAGAVVAAVLVYGGLRAWQSPAIRSAIRDTGAEARRLVRRAS